MRYNRPNILYVVCHDLGRTLGCYGKPVISPNLDRFASQGALFASAFCSSPACSPSRGCAVTGQYAHTNGLMGLVNQGWSLPESTRTIIDHLNDAGYTTAHVGLQHERYCAAANRYQIEGYRRRSDLYAENAVDRAIEFLEDHRKASRPFYLNVGTIEVHCSQWQGKRDDGERLRVYSTESLGRAYVPRVYPDIPQVRREMAKRRDRGIDPATLLSFPRKRESTSRGIVHYDETTGCLHPGKQTQWYALRRRHQRSCQARLATQERCG